MCPKGRGQIFGGVNMRFFSACYWRQERDGNASALLQQQYACQGARIHFSCVCKGQEGDGGAGGYMAEQLFRWFRGLSLKRLARRTGKALEGAEAGLRRAILRADGELAHALLAASGKVSLAGIFCVGEEFFLFCRGRQRIYFFNTGLGGAHIRRLGEEGGELFWQRGVLQPDVGLLLAAEPFCEHISERMLREALSVRETVTQEQLGKHLNELGEEARRRGGRDMAAVYVRTAREMTEAAEPWRKGIEGHGMKWELEEDGRMEEDGRTEEGGRTEEVDRTECGRQEEDSDSEDAVAERQRRARDRTERARAEEDPRAGENPREEDPRPECAMAERQSLEKRGYTVRRFLGRGAFSGVYEVEERGTGRKAACKISGNLRLLRREEEILRRLGHPLFPEYYGSWQEGGKGFLLMEEVQGENLARLIRRGLRLSARQAAEIGIELAEGLLYLHESCPPVIFRDVKPENIMLGKDGGVKLLDFGCACEPETGERTRAGTPGFAAPEQLAEGGEQTLLCDVYGLGRTLQELLRAGEAHARNGGSGGKHLCRRCEGLGERRDRKRLERLLDACVEEKPSARPPDMRVVAAALSRICLPDGRGRCRPGSGFWQEGIICEKNVRKSAKALDV